ncbi:hypothetical protein K4K53_004694 [Colletotrichum sp. SAR 10_77]|nr:hypothetical protein K4K53_004694 [Colletotrichum sp. SAR 10_77]
MITLVNDLVVIKDAEDAHNDPATHWLCVEKNGYFGFQNPQSGRYIGHDGGDYVYAKAMGLDGWEYLTPREHPEGGYQLLSPFYWHTLKMLCVDEDQKTVVRRNHGTTLWEFVRI